VALITVSSQVQEQRSLSNNFLDTFFRHSKKNYL